MGGKKKAGGAENDEDATALCDEFYRKYSFKCKNYNPK
jgi:hypothetical protein